MIEDNSISSLLVMLVVMYIAPAIILYRSELVRKDTKPLGYFLIIVMSWIGFFITTAISYFLKPDISR